MILGLLQARVSSSRLPGKVLEPILGEPLLFRQIERLGRCRRIERLVVTTSTEASDDVLVNECAHRNIAVHRGDLGDVLGRFACAAREFNPKTIVRLCGDCPLADWQLIDEAIETFEAGRYDYVTNADPPTYPDGLDVEVVSTEVLLQTATAAQLPSEREHVTLFIRRHPERFKIGRIARNPNLAALRWTVDNPEDLNFVRRVYEALYPGNAAFTTADILALLERRPQLTAINAHIARDEGLQPSLQRDQIWLRQESS